MENEINWLKSLLQKFDESLGSACSQSALLNEERRALHADWDDACGREMALRFLDPIEKKLNQGEKDLSSQRLKMEAAHGQLHSSVSRSQQAMACSREVDDSTQEFHYKENQISTLRESSTKRLSAAISLLNEAEGFLNEISKI